MRRLKFTVDTVTEIGARFLAVRRKLSYSQADLARRIGVTPARVMQIENGMQLNRKKGSTRPSRAVMRLFEALERRCGLGPGAGEEET